MQAIRFGRVLLGRLPAVAVKGIIVSNQIGGRYGLRGGAAVTDALDDLILPQVIADAPFAIGIDPRRRLRGV